VDGAISKNNFPKATFRCYFQKDEFQLCRKYQMTNQVPFSEPISFGTDNFADNPEPRCPCLLLLDISGSMSGNPIRELNDGLKIFRDELMADSLAAKRVEVAIVSFSPVSVVNDFQTADLFSPPNLTAQGDTPMGEAIERGLDLLSKRKETLRNNGIAFYRPWIFLITDGGPTDNWSNAASRVKEGETKKAFAFFAVGVEGARMDILSQMTTREPVKLKGLRFRDLFQWLSNSMKSVSHSKPGDTVPVQNPATPQGWATV